MIAAAVFFALVASLVGLSIAMLAYKVKLVAGFAGVTLLLLVAAPFVGAL